MLTHTVATARSKINPGPMGSCSHAKRAMAIQCVSQIVSRSYTARRTCAAAVTTRVFWGTARHGTGRAVKGVRLARAVDEVIRELTILSVDVCVLDKVQEKSANVECSTALCA